MNSVGERLREARLAKGLTQEQLARGLATKGFISQVERNRATPSLPKLRVLAERLGQPLSFFVTDRPPQLLTLLRKSAQLRFARKTPLARWTSWPRRRTCRRPPMNAPIFNGFVASPFPSYGEIGMRCPPCRTPPRRLPSTMRS